MIWRTYVIFSTIRYMNEVTGKELKPEDFQKEQYFHDLIDKNYTISDFRKVIDKKYKQWKGTQFEKYVRPQTLFNKNFENYLNEQSTSEAKLSKLFNSVEQAKRTDWKLD